MSLESIEKKEELQNNCEDDCNGCVRSSVLRLSLVEAAATTFHWQVVAAVWAALVTVVAEQRAQGGFRT